MGLQENRKVFPNLLEFGEHHLRCLYEAPERFNEHRSNGSKGRKNYPPKRFKGESTHMLLWRVLGVDFRGGGGDDQNFITDFENLISRPLFLQIKLDRNRECLARLLRPRPRSPETSSSLAGCHQEKCETAIRATL